MKRILLTALFIVIANAIVGKTLTIKHDKKLPTPHDLITKGTILDKTALHVDKNYGYGTMRYFIAWDKTDDIYWCSLYGTFGVDTNTTVRCRLATQQTESIVERSN